MWMDIFAHEFGHMIGLPDEYDALPGHNSNVAKDLVIHRFLGMADLYGTPKPTMGRMTTSIMCKGRDVLPCHMITALQALRTLTNDNNWRVG
jgi:Immune inhibitor A peptidase M6, catalytic domain